MVPCTLFSRSIRCLRNIIHWNLITAFILRNATWFVVQLTMNPEVHESNVVGAALPGSWPEPGPGWLGCVGSLRVLDMRPQKQLEGPNRVAWWLVNNPGLMRNVGSIAMLGSVLLCASVSPL